MTPQDGQPLTRRELRERERSGQAAPAAESARPAPPASPPVFTPPPVQSQTRRSRHHGGPAEEEMVVVATGTSGALSDEEAELAEVEDAPANPVPPVTIDQRRTDPVLSPVFQSPSSRTARGQDRAFDDLVGSRGVGASNSIATTSALVLPTVPHHGDVGSALDETGEVIITGSIDLPISLASTGAHPAAGLERSDLDSLVEGADRDHLGSDVAPMSASRAVSTHGSPAAMVAPPKRARVNAPLILAVTAGVLAVGVVGLLLAAFVFRIF